MAGWVLPEITQAATGGQSVLIAIGDTFGNGYSDNYANGQILPAIGQSMTAQIITPYDLHIHHGGPRTGWRHGKLGLQWRTGGPVKT